MVTEKTQSIQTGSQENDEDFDFNLDCSDIETSDDEISPALVCLISSSSVLETTTLKGMPAS